MPASMRNSNTLLCPTDDRVQESLCTTQTPTSWHQFLANAVPVDETAAVMQLALLPAFLVYNSFEMDIRVEELYEWVLSLNDQTPASTFLRACMVKRNVTDPKPS
eukprot:11773042-Ditylum_brightwellii.AAC.1